MQSTNDAASELEYKPFGLMRFVCEISHLLLLLRIRAVGQQLANKLWPFSYIGGHGVQAK
jgi:hypothetical protein